MFLPPRVPHHFIPIPAGWDPEQALRNHHAHVHALLDLVKGKDGTLLSYEQMYRNQYNLVSHGHGAKVYWYLRKLLNSMSLCMHKHEYYSAVELLCKVSLHLDNPWCVHHKLPRLIDCATNAYDRPVARRWRRALFMVRWAVRLPKWRAAFTEAWLRPGGVGEQQLAQRFGKHAASHHDNVAS